MVDWGRPLVVNVSFAREEILRVHVCGHTTLPVYISHILSSKELGKMRTSCRSNFCMTIPPNLSRYAASNAH